jgi:hypothetical protein
LPGQRRLDKATESVSRPRGRAVSAWRSEPSASRTLDLTAPRRRIHERWNGTAPCQQRVMGHPPSRVGLPADVTVGRHGLDEERVGTSRSPRLLQR